MFTLHFTYSCTSLSAIFFPPSQPESIGCLISLKDMWLDGNQLTEIPSVSQHCIVLPRFCLFPVVISCNIDFITALEGLFCLS